MIVQPTQPILPFKCTLSGGAGESAWSVPFALDDAAQYTTPLQFTATDLGADEVRSLSQTLRLGFYDPTNCSGAFSPPYGKRFDIQLDDGTALPWERARHLKALVKSQGRLMLEETHSDRYTEHAWLNCHVLETPKVNPIATEEGYANEYYTVQFSLVWISR